MLCCFEFQVELPQSRFFARIDRSYDVHADVFLSSEELQRFGCLRLFDSLNELLDLGLFNQRIGAVLKPFGLFIELHCANFLYFRSAAINFPQDALDGFVVLAVAVEVFDLPDGIFDFVSFLSFGGYVVHEVDHQLVPVDRVVVSVEDHSTEPLSAVLYFEDIISEEGRRNFDMRLLVLVCGFLLFLGESPFPIEAESLALVICDSNELEQLGGILL